MGNSLLYENQYTLSAGTLVILVNFNFQTGQLADFPEVSNQRIYPYTDLLLHTMGEGLSDNREEFDADGPEWRTPPLWSTGLIEKINKHNNLLHDGRARGFAEGHIIAWWRSLEI